MLSEETIRDYRKAGNISHKALQYGASLVKPGVLIRDVADKIEEYIIKNGCGMAFPVNISMNQTAAHDTAFPDDTRAFNDEIIKLDVGAHYNGYVGDNALTIDLSQKYTDLVKASQNALNNAIKIVAPGITLGEIGKTIQETIESEGFVPVRNLSGHQVDRFQIHCGYSIPNYATNDARELKEGMVIAIEPFATNGEGLIGEKGDPAIFSRISSRPTRNMISRNVIKEIEHYSTLPFASRWLQKKLSISQINFGIKDLLKNRIIEKYPPLVERQNGMVSQAENTIIVGEKTEIITKE